jgi:hypothetical protein
MGLLDDLPDSSLKLMRTAAQNRNPNVDLGADNAFDLAIVGAATAAAAPAAESRRTRPYGGRPRRITEPWLVR